MPRIFEYPLVASVIIGCNAEVQLEKQVLNCINDHKVFT